MQATGKGFASTVPEYRPSRINIKRKSWLQAYRLQLERVSNSKEFTCSQHSSLVLHKPKVPQILPRTSAMWVVRTQSHSPYLPGSPDGKEGAWRSPARDTLLMDQQKDSPSSSLERLGWNIPSSISALYSPRTSDCKQPPSKTSSF